MMTCQSKLKGLPRSVHDCDSFILEGDDEFSTMSLCTSHSKYTSNNSSFHSVDTVHKEYSSMPPKIQHKDSLHPSLNNQERLTNTYFLPTPLM